jgi:beta-1,4-mannosyl-glycoprotein beta-1,4-N-acetylglucosaminyltransferase
MITIVIPTMWKCHMLLSFLYDLVHVETVSEIIIINNDHKNTPRNDILFHEKVNMVDFGENIFVNPAWNYGVSQSKNNHICIMNDDITFDTRLFAKALEFMQTNPNFGSMGFNPGVEHLRQPAHTSVDIDFIEYMAGADALGYGSLMFVKKDQWRHIPDYLKIFCGDAFIFDRSQWMGLKNYWITNISHQIKYATTTTSIQKNGKPIAEGFLQTEGSLYESIIRQNPQDYITPVIDSNSQLTPRKLLIDCFTFFNEYDILEGRLEYLYDFVDYFIITESNLSFAGNEKPLNFLNNIDRYERFKRKIIYHPFITEKNSYNFVQNIDVVDYDTGQWVMERAQRNHITTALNQFKQDVYVMVSDVDEIPSRHALDFVINNFPDTEFVSFVQDFFYYNLTNKNDNIQWRGTVMTTKANAIQHGTQYLRHNSYGMLGALNGGWHLSYFGSAEKIIEKIENFSHQEYNKSHYKQIDKINNAIANGLDVYTGAKTLSKVDANYFPDDFYKIFSKFQTN